MRQTEQLVKKLLQEKTASPSTAPAPLTVNYVEEAQKELSEQLGRPCRIVPGRKKGRIELDYYGSEDLNDLLDALATLNRKNGVR